LNEVARLYTHSFCVILLVVLTFIFDIVLVLFLEISYHLPSVTCEVLEVYEGEHLCHILLSEFEYITKTGWMFLIKVSFSQGPGWFHGLKV